MAYNIIDHFYSVCDNHQQDICFTRKRNNSSSANLYCNLLKPCKCWSLHSWTISCGNRTWNLQGISGTNEALYEDIEYSCMSLCEQDNNYTIQTSYRIYPTINMSQVVVRCSVYLSSQARCWGEQVVVIQYINPTIIEPMDCMPSPTSVMDERHDTITTLASDPDQTPCDTLKQTITIIGVLIGVVAMVAAIEA